MLKVVSVSYSCGQKKWPP